MEDVTSLVQYLNRYFLALCCLLFLSSFLLSVFFHRTAADNGLTTRKPPFQIPVSRYLKPTKFAWIRGRIWQDPRYIQSPVFCPLAADVHAGVLSHSDGFKGQIKAKLPHASPAVVDIPELHTQDRTVAKRLVPAEDNIGHSCYAAGREEFRAHRTACQGNW